MLGSIAYIFAVSAGAHVTQEAKPCPAAMEASKVVNRLSDLPDEVRADLSAMSHGEMVDGPVSLRPNHASTAAERLLPTSKFNKGYFLKGAWFVQFEVSGTEGLRTIGYVQSGTGRFSRSPMYYFAGPSCAVLRAVIDGVITPGGYNF